jgi:hypothetical protein
VTVDIDGVLVLAHSDKEDAARTWKTYGHHPLFAFVDHGAGGAGEPVAALLRPGNAGSNTAADHIEATQLALAQLPAPKLASRIADGVTSRPRSRPLPRPIFSLLIAHTSQCRSKAWRRGAGVRHPVDVCRPVD